MLMQLKKLGIPILILVSLLLIPSIASAQYGLGDPKAVNYNVTITVNQSSIAVPPGATANLSYTVVQKGKGNGYQAFINVANYQQLANDKIYVTPSPQYGNPTYSGKIKINVGAGAATGNYTILLNGTGQENTRNNTVIALFVGSSVPFKGPKMTLYGETSALSKSSIVTNISLTNQNGVTLHVSIPVGTYAEIDNKTYSQFNFTLATFNLTNVTAPNPSQVAEYGFAYEVNNQISQDIEFTNSTGSPKALTTKIGYPAYWTSWAWLGGSFNGSAYIGGDYVAQNTWTSSGGTLTNTQFSRPIMWVFTINLTEERLLNVVNAIKKNTTTTNPGQPITPSSNQSTVSSPPKPSASLLSGNNLYYGAGAVVVIIIIAVLLMRRGGKKQPPKVIPQPAPPVPQSPIPTPPPPPQPV
jgi:hypothetical protein